MPATDAIKIELGGGTKPYGHGYLNLDKIAGPTVDSACDFETDDLPFPDDSVRAVCSSHCFEHFQYGRVLREIARVCRIGATVTIRVPCWLSENALTPGHIHTLGPEEAERFGGGVNEHYWSSCAKRLHLTETQYVPSRHFAEAKSLFPHLSDDQVIRFIPNACWEIQYVFAVVEND